MSEEIKLESPTGSPSGLPPVHCSARWATGLPPVAKGKAKSFIVTIEGERGWKYVTCCNYLNEYWMEWADDADPDESEIDEEGGKKWTGWMYDREQWGGELSTCKIEGSVIGWLELPCAKGSDDSVSWPNTDVSRETGEKGQSNAR